MRWRARDLLEHEGWLDYARTVYSIDPGDHPFLSYVGLNFTERAVKNFKLYFSFFRRLEPEEIALLLPVPDRGRFDSLYPTWQPSQTYETIHRGTTFALKIDADGTLTHYCHFRVPGMPVGPPERLELSDSDRHELHGVCEEFTGSAINLKRYYYCRDKATIAQSLELCELDAQDQVQWIDWLEYIESEGRDKMAWITASTFLIEELIERRAPAGLSYEISKLCRDCGFVPFGPGSARGGSDHSIYLIEPQGSLHPGGYLFDGVSRFVEKHLGLNGLGRAGR